MEGKCIVSKMSLDMMRFYGITSKDMDGIVNQLRYTKGVEVSIFMYELEPMKWKISLRSCGLVNVAKVAEFFGGGGHVRASGCNIAGSFHDVVNNLSAQIALQLQ
jgi:phosphoesterase RecJ-like protein